MVGTDTVEYLYIDKVSPYYRKAVDLRYEVFFKPFNTGYSAIYDELEDISLHLVAVYDGGVVGYIRFTIDRDVGIISQFVVSPDMRGIKGIAVNLFRELINKGRAEKLSRIVGNIRLHMENAARYYGFTVSDETFPSPKTGLPHKKIEMLL